VKEISIEFKKYKSILYILILYILSIIILSVIHVISMSDFIDNLVIFFGWIIILVIALIQLKENREDNQIAQKEEIRRSLEIDAFKETNKARYELSNSIGSMHVLFLLLPSDLLLCFKNPKANKFDKNNITLKIRLQIDNLLKSLENFIVTIENNEIALIGYHHYRLFLTFRIKDIIKKIDGFQSYFGNLTLEKLSIEENFIYFEEYCYTIRQNLSNIAVWLHDYRIELMNSMLEDIFEKKVPTRKAKDPKFKTLMELATKEKVEKESIKREKIRLKRN